MPANLDTIKDIKPSDLAALNQVAELRSVVTEFYNEKQKNRFLEWKTLLSQIKRGASEKEIHAWAEYLAKKDIEDEKKRLSLLKPADPHPNGGHLPKPGELAALSQVPDLGPAIESLFQQKLTDRIAYWKTRLASLTPGVEKPDQVAATLAEKDIADEKSRLAPAEVHQDTDRLPNALQEARNDLRQRLVSLRRVLEAYRKVAGTSPLSLRAKELLEHILKRFHKIKHDQPLEAAETVKLSYAEEEGWKNTDGPLQLDDWKAPGVRLDFQGKIDFNEVTRTAFQDASPGAQFIVGDSTSELVTRWSEDEELPLVSAKDLASVQQRRSLVEVLGLNRAVVLYGRALEQLLAEERAVLGAERWLTEVREQSAESSRPFEVKKSIEPLRTRLEQELEVYLASRIESEGKRIVDAKARAEEALAEKIEKYQETLDRAQPDDLPPFLKLHQSAGQADATENQWIVDHTAVKEAVAQRFVELPRRSDFHFAHHLAKRFVTPELERLNIRQNGGKPKTNVEAEVSLLPLVIADFDFYSAFKRPDDSGLSKTAATTVTVPTTVEQASEAAGSQSAEKSPAKGAKILNGLRLAVRRFFLRYPFVTESDKSKSPPNSEAVWSLPPSPAQRGTMYVIGGLLKEAAMTPMKVLGPIFAVFAPLMILGIANPLKQATKGVSDAVTIPNGFLLMFLLTALLTAGVFLVFRAACKYQGERGSLRRMLITLVAIWAVILCIGWSQIGLPERVLEHRKQALHQASANAFWDEPDAPTRCCHVWERHLEKLSTALTITAPLDQGAPISMTDENSVAMNKAVIRWQKNAAGDLGTKIKEIDGKLPPIREKKNTNQPLTESEEQQLAYKETYDALGKFIDEINKPLAKAKSLDREQRQMISRAAWDSGVHPFQEMLWWSLTEKMKTLASNTPPITVPAAASEISYQRGFESFEKWKRAWETQRNGVKNVYDTATIALNAAKKAVDDKVKDAETQFAEAEKKLITAKANFEKADAIKPVNEWKTKIDAFDKLDPMAARDWDLEIVQQVDAFSVHRFPLDFPSFQTSQNLTAIFAPVAAKEGSAPPPPTFLARLDILRSYKIAQSDTNPAYVEAAKRSATTLSRIKANKDIAELLLPGGSSGAPNEQSGWLVAVAWVAGIGAAVAALIWVVIFFGGRAEGRESVRNIWQVVFWILVAHLCVLGLTAGYKTLAAGNDAQHVEQRLINGLHRTASVWADDTSPSPYSMLMAEREQAVEEKDKVDATEVGPRSSKPWGALAVFTALFVALLWSGYLALRALKRQHDVALRAILTQMKQRAVTALNQNLDLEFRAWSTRTKTNVANWLDNVLREVELKMEEASRRNTTEFDRKTAGFTKDARALKGRSELLKDLEKVITQVGQGALALRRAGAKTFKA